MLQSISDHEPDYHSLKRDTHTLCQGPQDEQELIARNSSLRDSSSQFVAEQLADTAKQYAPVAEQQSTSTGQPSSAAAVSRPGQAELEQTLSEYDRRLEELKSKLRGSLSEREQQLESAKECEGLLEGVMSWLDVCEADLDGLRVRDPSSAVIEEQQQNCQVHKHVCLGYAVLLCLVFCLTLLASFFLSSFSSLIKTCIYMYVHGYTCA